jgi:uncharacterized protein (DUF697 family)
MPNEASENADTSEIMGITRKEEAGRIVSKYIGWSAGTGAIPFPLWDVAAVAAVQIKMVKDLLALYEKPFSENKTKSSLSILIGSLSPHLLAGVTASSLFKFVPGVGHVLSALTLPLLSSAASYAVGKVMVAHLESGGSLANFDAHAVTDKFKDAFEEGKEKVKSATAKTSTANAS